MSVKDFETMQFINAVYELSRKHDFNFVPKEAEDLIDIMSKPVENQMWNKYYSREKNYGITAVDIGMKQYKGYDEDALEKYRLEGLNKIEKEPDPLKKLDIFMEYARNINEAIKMLDLMDCISSETRTLVSIDVCSNMFDSGKYTLTEIKAIMPWLEISNIYGASKILDKEIAITEDELQLVKAEYHKSGQPTILKEMFGEPENNQMTWKEIYEKVTGAKNTDE